MNGEFRPPKLNSSGKSHEALNFATTAKNCSDGLSRVEPRLPEIGFNGEVSSNGPGLTVGLDGLKPEPQSSRGTACYNDLCDAH
jgi:hypothetical protein